MGIRKLRHIKELDAIHEPSQFNSDQDSEDLAKKIVELCLFQKSLDTVAYDVSSVSNIAKIVIIASGTSNRHVKGISDKIMSGLKDIHTEPSRIDGYDDGEWIVLDYDDVIVHLFFEPKRQYYEFDSLFIGAEKIELPEVLRTKARQFKTGLHAI